MSASESDPNSNANDPFDTLGLAPTFPVDDVEIQRRWLRRTADLHPDRAADPAAASAELARVNAARNALIDPERAAAALLRRLGGPTADEHPDLPPDVLETVLDLRSSIEEADGPDAASARHHVHAWATEQRTAALTRIAERFRSLATPPDPAALADIRTELNGLRYIERTLAQIASPPDI